MPLNSQAPATTHLIFYSCLLAILGGLGLFLQQHTSEQQRAQFSTYYGQALVQSTAKQAIEPAITQDMISLQVILQSITAQATVIGATAHSADNQLLVQSGRVPPQGGAPNNFPKFTSPIALNDQIVGYITITLDLTRAETNYGPLLLWLAFISAAILLLWFINKPGLFNTHRPSTNNTIEPMPSGASASSPSASVIIELTLLNIAKLHQQLTAEAFQSRLEQLDQRLKDVLTLYTGFKHHFAHNRLSLRIEADSQSCASFHATCISLLVHRLNEKSAAPNFKIATAITPFKTWVNADAILDGYLSGYRPEQKEPVIWVDPQLSNDDLLHKITLNSEHQLQSIKPPYNDLLARQEKQLTNLIKQDKH